MNCEQTNLSSRCISAPQDFAMQAFLDDFFLLLCSRVRPLFLRALCDMVVGLVEGKV